MTVGSLTEQCFGQIAEAFGHYVLCVVQNIFRDGFLRRGQGVVSCPDQGKEIRAVSDSSQ